MAFHPFQSFRRHQKVFMAGLVIMCMFIFILQFGKGDVLDRMMNWFGASRMRTTEVATVYGEKVSDVDLDKLRRQRELANTIVLAMTDAARRAIVTELDPQRGKGLEQFDEVYRFDLLPIVQGLIRNPRGLTRREEMDVLGMQVGRAGMFAAQNRAEVIRQHEQLQR